MNFSRIEYLFLIWSIPLLALLYYYGMSRRKHILSQFAAAQSLRAISNFSGNGLRIVKACLVLLGLIFLILSMSGPRYGYTWQKIQRKGVDIIIALDCSKSMMAKDIQPTRLDRAKREVYDLLTMLKGDRVGLVAFAGTSFLQCPLTLDYGAFNIFLKSLTPDYLPLGGTALADAIQTATASFEEKSNAEKAVILITDGENTGEKDPISAAEAARDAGIKLFCIGVGGKEGVPIPNTRGGFRKEDSGRIILSRLDENLLKQMSALTQGAYVRSVAGDMDLDVIYEEEIRGEMKQAALSEGRKKIWEDRYQWLLGIAIALIALEFFIPSVRYNHMTILPLIFLTCYMAAPSTALAGPADKGLDSYQKGEYEKALEFYTKAQVENPENPKLFYNLGNVHYKAGNYEAAQENYIQALNSDDNTLKQKTYYNLGNTSFRKGELESAIKNYEAALSLTPDDAQAKENLEFVKKVMAQQKKQQKGNKDQKQKKKNDKADSKPQKSPASDQKKKQEDQNPQNPQSPESKKDEKSSESTSPRDYGSEMKNDAQHPRPEKSEKEKSPGQHQQTKNASGKQNAETPSIPSEKLLNRLEDEPGKAMIPFYKKKNVEKDW